ncbi:thymidine phosphorylase [archaeon]|jgi:putative thymidine phosphorylase|nr:thymidine phosphorylase [archaeon]
MELRVRIGKWSAGLPVVMLRKETAEELGVHAKQRLSIKTSTKKPKEISAILDIVETVVKEKQLVVSKEVKDRLNLKSGDKVDVSISSPPTSLRLIKEKLNGKILSRKKIKKIIQDIVDNNLSEPEVALFVSAVYQKGMNFKETISLIKSILDSGQTLGLKKKIIVDKHSIGGIPGNRTTPIVVAICAAAGLTFPKTSSRAITSAAGTADTIETIAKVDFSAEKLREIIKKTNACLAWGGALGMVPADSKIISVEKSLRIDSEPQLLASIISKKLAVGSNYLVVDIPYGKYAKVSKQKAEHLKLKFEKIAKYFKIKIKVVLTKGNQPIGNGIGPALEIKDVLAVLNPKKQGPRDLEGKSLFLAGEIFELTKRAKPKKGYAMAKKILDSGDAYKKFREIIHAQKGHINHLREAKYKKDIRVRKSGKLKEINNKEINQLARVAGCPLDKFAGVYLHKHTGDLVRKGEKVMTIYAESRARLNQALKYYEKERPLKCG